MNRMILKYKYPFTFVILAILAWVVYRRIMEGGSELLLFFASILIVWVLGTLVFIYLWPSFTYTAYKKAVVQHGRDGGPIPINTLYATPKRSSASAPDNSLMGTGSDDVLYIGGWLDLTKGPQILHVPGFGDRYYSVQFTDPADGVDFAYVGTRTTGSKEADFIITGPRWNGQIPSGMKQIPSPNKSVLVIGRVMVTSDHDVLKAHELAKQVCLAPLNG